MCQKACCSSLPWQLVWQRVSSLLPNLPSPPLVIKLSWRSWGHRTQHHSSLCPGGIRTAMWFPLCSQDPGAWKSSPRQYSIGFFLITFTCSSQCLLSCAYISTSKTHQLRSTHYAAEQKSVPVQSVCASVCFHISVPKHKNRVTALASSWKLQFSKVQFGLLDQGAREGLSGMAADHVPKAAAMVAYDPQD